MKITLKYGTDRVLISVPRKNLVDTLNSRPLPRVPNKDLEVEESLSNPIGAPRLHDVVKPGDRVILIVDDKTRPCPRQLLLRHLLEGLESSGVHKSDIQIILALGTHEPHTPSEMMKLLGKEIMKNYHVFDHTPTNHKKLVYVGKTRRGTNIVINIDVFSADVKIGISYIGVHDFAGYTGGAKCILPGVSATKTIMENHKLAMKPSAQPGEIDGNPVRADIEEAASKAGLDFIVNVVLNSEGELVKAVSGDFIKAHREGVKVYDSMYKVVFDKKVELAIVSAGGYPHDINLYQAEKCISYAQRVLKDGGYILVLAKCPEGYGGKSFEETLLAPKSSTEIKSELMENFDIGTYVAWDLKKILERLNVILVSNLPHKKVENLKQVTSIDKALEECRHELRGDFRTLIIPDGSTTLPTPYKEEKDAADKNLQ